MRRLASRTVAPLCLVFAVACTGAPAGSHATHTSSTAGSTTGTTAAGTGGTGGIRTSGGAGGAGGAGVSGTGGAGPDGGTDCSVDGNPGQCMEVSACATLPGHTSAPGFCPGPADIECCTLTPDVADNPPIPAGYQLMAQADVTAAMTAWAVSILDDPTDYPMFSTAMRTFGTLMVLARVEWHPPDFQNMAVHRGVTLYEPG